MKFRVGDKVEVTWDFEDAPSGMEGEVIGYDEEYSFVRFPGWGGGHDGHNWLYDQSPLPEGSTEGYFIPEDHLELIEQEKPVKQVYEVGGTLTDAKGKVHEIIDVRQANEKNVRIAGGEWVNADHFVYTPPVKPVPMTRELQEALDRYLDYAGAPTPTEAGEYSKLYAAYQKAKEQAK